MFYVHTDTLLLFDASTIFRVLFANDNLTHSLQRVEWGPVKKIHDFIQNVKKSDIILIQFH